MLQVDLIDQVIINTDAKEILLDNGLEESSRVLIRQRKEIICGDNVSMNLVIADDLENSEGKTYVMTHTTNPILRSKTIEKAIKTYLAGKELGESDSLFAVNKHQTRFYRKDTTPINHDPKNLIPTQDLDEWFEENSCLYIFSKESFLSTNARIDTHYLKLQKLNLSILILMMTGRWQRRSADHLKCYNCVNTPIP